MTACNFYPKFEPNQVLTSEQLNQLTAFFEKHDRLTRSKLIGAGIFCGFDMKFNNSAVSLNISEGVGTTSEGYLVYLPATVLTRYRPYKDPGKYKKFGDENSQIKLWELLPAVIEGEDETIEKLTKKFLNDKAVILYLEKYDQDLETCTGDDCNEKGIRVNQCVKILLINLTDLNVIIKQCRPAKKMLKAEEISVSKFKLPEISIKRESQLISKYKYEDYKSISKLYMDLIKPPVKVISKALAASYDTFEPVLINEYVVNPFKEISIEKNIDEILKKYEHGIQYVYDYLKDTILAYNEFKEAAFNLASECCFNEDCFPRHLMLGEALPVPNCEPSVYRQKFIQSPVYNGQNELLKKVLLLFKRLVHINYSFNIETGKSVEVKITPSNKKGTELSERSIPYYYKPAGKDPILKENVLIHHLWNYNFNKKCKPYLNLGYYSNLYKEELTPDFVKNPLLYDSDKYGFYRIEGHLDKSCDTVMPGLLNDVKNNNLPVKIIKLHLGKEYSGKDLKLDCRFTDLELTYQSIITECLCFLRQKVKYFAQLDFGSGETGEKQTGNIKGSVITDKNEPLPGVNVTLKDAAGQKIVMGAVTDAKGNFVINNVNTGQYLVSASFTGFKDTSTGVTVKAGQTEIVKIKLDTAGAAGYTFEDMKKLYEGIMYSGYKYSDMSKTEGAGAKYTPEEMVKMFASGTYSSGDFLKKSGEYTLTDKSVGNMYLNYTETGSKDFIKYIADNKDRFSNIIGGATEVNIIDKYYRPVKLIESIEAVASSLAEKIINFDEVVVEAKEKELNTIASDYRNNIYQNLKDTNYTRTGRESEIIVHLTELIENCCLNRFKSLIESYKKRAAEVLNLTLFSKFIADHPGAVHMAGVPAGGTFIIVCDIEGTVVADFALPYICCSDCPPIAFVAAPVQVVFKLPKDTFCADDNTEYTVIAEPAGGVVKGDGISKDPQTGEYKFNPADAGAGLKKLTYTVNLKTHELLVNVIKVEAKFTFTLSAPEPDTPKRTAKFTAYPTDAESYVWNFGDGSGELSEQNPEHTFTLDDEQEFDVSLTVKSKGCSGTFTDTVKIPYCTAEFSYKVTQVVNDVAVVSFDSLMKGDAEFDWNFGNNATSDLADPLNEYNVSKKNTFNVVLKVKKGDCTDEETKTITIKTCSAKFNFDQGGVEGNKFKVSFSAETLDAETYIWDFGDDTTFEDKPSIEHQYILKETEQTVTVQLSIKKGICSSTYSTKITLPPAEKIEFSLDGNIFCKKVSKSHQFTLSTEGKVVGPGVDLQNGNYFFNPAKDDVKEGLVTFAFLTASGGKAELTVRVLNPIADFKLGEVTQPNPETDPSTYKIATSNTSTGAKQFEWRLGGKLVSESLQPVISISGAEPGLQYVVTLTAVNGKCSDVKRDVITIPTSPSHPVDVGGTVDVSTFNPDNTVVDGTSGNIAVGENVDAVFNNNLNILNNLTSHSEFDAALSTNVAAYRDTKKYFNTVSEELADAGTRKLYSLGAKDNEIAENLSGLLNTTYKRIEKYEGAGSEKLKQFTYNLVLIQLSELFNLISLRKEDIKTGSSIELVLKEAAKIMAAVKEMKVNINAGNRLSDMIRSAVKTASNKPVFLTALKRLNSVI